MFLGRLTRKTSKSATIGFNSSASRPRAEAVHYNRSNDQPGKGRYGETGLVGQRGRRQDLMALPIRKG